MKGFSSYEFYRDEYYGKLNQEEYTAAARKASTLIMSATNGLAVNLEAVMQDNLAMCECELADAIYGYDQAPKGVSSVNNDGYSVTYVDREAYAQNAYMQICRRYLQYPVNLMCRWL